MLGLLCRRTAVVIVCVAILALLAPPAPAQPKNCPVSGKSYTVHYETFSGISTSSELCPNDLLFHCEEAKQPAAPLFRLTDPSCDPKATTCTVELVVPLEMPGTQQNIDAAGFFSALKPSIYWYEADEAPRDCEPWEDTECGQVTICGPTGIGADLTDTFVQQQGLGCDALQDVGVFSLSVFSCGGRSSPTTRTASWPRSQNSGWAAARAAPGSSPGTATT